MECCRDLPHALLEDLSFKKKTLKYDTQTGSTSKERLSEYVLCVCFSDFFEYDNIISQRVCEYVGYKIS